jgi:hypothetical protein
VKGLCRKQWLLVLKGAGWDNELKLMNCPVRKQWLLVSKDAGWGRERTVTEWRAA